MKLQHTSRPHRCHALQDSFFRMMPALVVGPSARVVLSAELFAGVGGHSVAWQDRTDCWGQMAQNALHCDVDVRCCAVLRRLPMSRLQPRKRGTLSAGKAFQTLEARATVVEGVHRSTGVCAVGELAGHPEGPQPDSHLDVQCKVQGRSFGGERGSFRESSATSANAHGYLFGTLLSDARI